MTKQDQGPQEIPVPGRLRRAFEAVNRARLPERAVLVSGMWVLAVCPLLVALGASVPDTSLPIWPLELGAGVGLVLSGVLEELHIGDPLRKKVRSASFTTASSRRLRFPAVQFRRVDERSPTITASRSSAAPSAMAPLGHRVQETNLGTAAAPTSEGVSRPVPQFGAVARMLADIDLLESDLSGSSEAHRRAAAVTAEPPTGRCAGCDVRLDDRSESHSACADCHGLLCIECGADALHDGHDGRCPTCWTLYETFVKKSGDGRWGRSLPSSARGS